HLLTWLQSRATWMDRRKSDNSLLPVPPQVALSQTPLPAGGSVTLSAPAGTIYYTLNGNDPRAPGGAIAGSAYAGAITVASAAELVARVRDSGGHWSTPTAMSLLAPDLGPRFLPGGSGDWTSNANW